MKKKFLLPFLLLALTACGGEAERAHTENGTMQTDFPVEEGREQEMKADTQQNPAVPDITDQDIESRGALENEEPQTPHMLIAYFSQRENILAGFRRAWGLIW